MEQKILKGIQYTLYAIGLVIAAVFLVLMIRMA